MKYFTPYAFAMASLLAVTTPAFAHHMTHHRGCMSHSKHSHACRHDRMHRSGSQSTNELNKKSLEQARSMTAPSMSSAQPPQAHATMPNSSIDSANAPTAKMEK